MSDSTVPESSVCGCAAVCGEIIRTPGETEPDDVSAGHGRCAEVDHPTENAIFVSAGHGRCAGVRRLFIAAHPPPTCIHTTDSRTPNPHTDPPPRGGDPEPVGPIAERVLDDLADLAARQRAALNRLARAHNRSPR